MDATKQEKGQAVTKQGQTWEWETPHGLVKLSLDLVRRYFCPDATEPEVMHFLAVCKFNRLNPWLKEAWLVKYESGEAAQIVVAKDYFVRRASEHPQYAGFKAGILVGIKDQAGKLILDRREGCFFVEGETLLGGWCEVYRSDREFPTLVEITLKEAIRKKKDGTPTKFWRDNEATMVRKVPVSRAHREAFPKEFEGLLDESEVGEHPGPMTIDMPMSIAQAESPARPPQGDPGMEGAATTPAGDTQLSLAEEARVRERAEEKARNG